MKRLIAMIGTGALAMVLLTPARAEVGSIDFGINPTVTNNVTSTSATAVGTAVAVTGQDACGLLFMTQGNAAGTGLVTITFQRSPDNVNWETSPKFTWINALNGTTAVVGYTNLPNTVVGAAGYIRVYSIQNADASASGTNSVLNIVKKTIKASP